MAKKKGKKQKWIVTARWKALSKEQQVDEVRTAMAEQGATNKSTATKLGTTPGTVAGIRYKNDIPSTNEPRGQAAIKARLRPTPARVVAAKPSKQPDLRPLKMAASEATQCCHIFGDNTRCGGEQEPDSRYCARHQ